MISSSIPCDSEYLTDSLPYSQKLAENLPQLFLCKFLITVTVDNLQTMDMPRTATWAFVWQQAEVYPPILQHKQFDQFDCTFFGNTGAVGYSMPSNSKTQTISTDSTAHLYGITGAVGYSMPSNSTAHAIDRFDCIFVWQHWSSWLQYALQFHSTNYSTNLTAHLYGNTGAVGYSIPPTIILIRLHICMAYSGAVGMPSQFHSTYKSLHRHWSAVYID
jgi:hypothetical protein